MVRTILTDAYVIRHCPLYQPLNEGREAALSKRIIQKQIRVGLPVGSEPRPITGIALYQALHNVREAMGVDEDFGVQVNEEERQELADEVMDEVMDEAEYDPPPPPVGGRGYAVAMAAMAREQNRENTRQQARIEQHHGRAVLHRDGTAASGSRSQTERARVVASQRYYRPRIPRYGDMEEGPAVRRGDGMSGGNIPAQRPRHHEGQDSNRNLFHPGRR